MQAPSPENIYPQMDAEHLPPNDSPLKSLKSDFNYMNFIAPPEFF